MYRCFQMLRREGQIWDQLHHPNVLPFYGEMERADWVYLISPWMEHRDLHRFLAARSDHLSLSPSTEVEHAEHLLYFFAGAFSGQIYGVACGLAYLHERGVIHCDLKPGNIFLDPLLRPLIADFDLSKDQTNGTLPGREGWGTLAYQSPESITEEIRNRASDVYALGMIIAEILTGKTPMSHIPSKSALILAVVQNKRPAREPLEFQGRDFTGLWEIAESCWQEDPELRPSASEVVRRLDAMRGLEWDQPP